MKSMRELIGIMDGAKPEKTLTETTHLNEVSFSNYADIDSQIMHILQTSDDVFREQDEALIEVSNYLRNEGFSNNEILQIMDNLENYLHDQSMQADMSADEPSGSYDMSDDADALASAGHGSDEDYGDFGNEEFEEAFDLNNGYNDVTEVNGDDFFPNGADSPVVKAVGPSGARQGDNPMQKKMQVAEVHKELVYGYRNYLKETAVSVKKKILKENAQISDLSVYDYYGDFDVTNDSIDYNSGINVHGKALTRDGKTVDIGFDLDVLATAPWEWEQDDTPTGWDHGRDQPSYTTSTYASVGTPEIKSLSFSKDQDFIIDDTHYSVQDAHRIIDPMVLRQLLNPALYTSLMSTEFDKQGDNIPAPEQDYDGPGPDDYDPGDDRY